MTCTTFLELNVVRNVDVKKSQPESVSEFLSFVLCMFNFPCNTSAKENRLLHFLLLQFSGILVEI